MPSSKELKYDHRNQRKLEKRVCLRCPHTFKRLHGVNEYGHKEFETTRSEMGDLVYQLKYGGDKSVVGKIVDRLEKYKGLETMDAIVPIPSTNKDRTPVNEIARELGVRIGVQVLEDVLGKESGGQELKNVEDPDERRELLKEQMTLNNAHGLAGKNILLIDDLYRSGSTLSVATDILMEQVKAAGVFVLTMTKTRSNR